MDPRITARFGDAARLLGDTKLKLVEHGPFAWLQTEAVLTFDVRAMFLEDNRWVPRERNLATFEHIIACVRPPLDDWQPIVRAHAALTFDDPILDEEKLRDLGDARWYVMPIGDAERAAWHAPRLDDRGLAWFVERFPHRAELARVHIDRAYRVVVESV